MGVGDEPILTWTLCSGFLMDLAKFVNLGLKCDAYKQYFPILTIAIDMNNL